jgi:hypothetical protein
MPVRLHVCKILRFHGTKIYNIVFCLITPVCPVRRYKHLGEIYCFHLEGHTLSFNFRKQLTGAQFSVITKNISLYNFTLVVNNEAIAIPHTHTVLYVILSTVNIDTHT